MNQIFWLVEGQLCGRSGPNRDPWSLTEIAAGGVGAILSVNEAESVSAEEVNRAGLEHACIPLAPNAPPMAGDLELCLDRLPKAYRFVANQIARGRVTMVHCRQGKDRTGLFMAYFLLNRYKLEPGEAIARVKAARPIALTATGWDAFAVEVLRSAPPLDRVDGIDASDS